MTFDVLGANVRKAQADFPRHFFSPSPCCALCCCKRMCITVDFALGL
jgi:hypothetical protein